jgi:hypothetical protein
MHTGDMGINLAGYTPKVAQDRRGLSGLNHPAQVRPAARLLRRVPCVRSTLRAAAFFCAQSRKRKEYVWE